MPLPTITTPTYELNLPSTGKKIKYRPFLVKEEKVMLIVLVRYEIVNELHFLHRFLMRSVFLSVFTKATRKQYHASQNIYILCDIMK